MKRRHALAVISSAGMASLSGCTIMAELFGDDGNSEAETRILTKYESGYNHYQTAKDYLRSGFEAYEREEFRSAESSFENAEQPFSQATSDFSSIEIDTISETGSEDLATIIGRATGTASGLSGRSDRLAEAAAVLAGDSVGIIGEDGAHERIQSAQSDLQIGEIDISTPDEIESEF